LIIVRLLIALALCVLLTACATHRPDASSRVELPMLRLAPAALGQNLALEQRLVFVRGGQRRELDALLEVDASQVRLLVQAMGQSAVRLVWDGQRLDEQRAPWLPPQVRGERVLGDLQFGLWPLPAVRAMLPPGWRVEQTGSERRLLDAQGQAWLIARDTGGLGNLLLRNLSEDYELEVRSVPVQKDAP
jgi:hypothetical protein